ncbi:tetratricopeptide repeat protein 12 isoform X2 [Ahaetulla prasina]|uniref:tetratricopeptide repeat protein 12 isoform X2 n=1 Tax=Ahaetulla prasina TaxID=499056 RepID=UPI00264731B8|nr:tetratricopeptide repeat protein 12 isoform X2 [Ahaetulla prasina]
MAEERELQGFLREVDEVAALVEGLKSTDPAVQEKATADTEKRFRSISDKDGKKPKPKVDRTVINKQPSPGLSSQEETTAESFLAVLEKDAQERARRRKGNEASANALKEKGNDAFSQGDYASAVQNYTEGLKKQKDMLALYTNRAQAYIKLRKYEKAIYDCSWALRCDEKCTKALFHMGKAYLAKKDFHQARECYLKILEIDPRKEKLCKDCIDEIDLEEKRLQEEEGASEDLKSGKPTAVAVNEMLQKLSTPDQDALYYAGGIRLLTDLVQTCTEQTLFRTNDGFSIISDNEVIERVLSAKINSPVELELACSLLLLWQAVCKGNEENQRLLLTHPSVNAQLPALLCSEAPKVQEQCVALLSLYAETEHGRILLIRHLNTTKWLQTLISLVKVADSRAASAMNLLTHLILEENFKIQCRIKLSTETLPIFIQLLSSSKAPNETVLSRCIAIMGDLCSDLVIRIQMSENQECWQACLSFVNQCWNENSVARYPECLYAILGLMMNLSLEPNSVVEELAEEICDMCMSLFSSPDGRIITRAVGLLNHILPASPKALEEAVRQNVVRKMIRFLKAGGQTTTDYAMKVLATCAKSSRLARMQIVKQDKKCSLLLKLLSCPNEVVAGNAAFCLEKCLEVPGTATMLLDTDVVRILLRATTRGAQRPLAQKNAAIALGKLCTADARHTSRLRELNGMAALSASISKMPGL